MSLVRLAAALSLPVLLIGPVLAKEPAPGRTPPAAAAGKPAPDPRDKEPNASPGRQRQLRCGAEWRALSAAEKTAQGPKWPQFYSRCVKRLKLPNA